jgi:hypothetical protein
MSDREQESGSLGAEALWDDHLIAIRRMPRVVELRDERKGLTTEINLLRVSTSEAKKAC